MRGSVKSSSKHPRRRWAPHAIGAGSLALLAFLGAAAPEFLSEEFKQKFAPYNKWILAVIGVAVVVEIVRGIVAARANDDPPEGVSGNLGNVYFSLGKPRKAIEFCEQALMIRREIGDRKGEGIDLGNIGNVYADLGKPRRAIEFYKEALVIDREIGDRKSEGIDLFNLSMALNELGERAQAIANAEAALKIFEKIDSHHADEVRRQLAEWRGQAGTE